MDRIEIITQTESDGFSGSAVTSLAALLEANDPFQRFWNTPGTERHQPCFIPSRNRNRYMETVREIEAHPERFPEW